MRREMLFGCRLLAVLASLFLFAVPSAQPENVWPVLITQDVDESKLVTLGGNTRPEAKAKYDRGRVDDNLLMEHLLLLLKRSPEQERELGKSIDDLHDLSSPNFHRWLTAKEFGERFGVAEQDRDTIKNWLQSHGIKAKSDYTNGLLIDFSGTAGPSARNSLWIRTTSYRIWTWACWRSRIRNTWRRAATSSAPSRCAPTIRACAIRWPMSTWRPAIRTRRARRWKP